MNSYLEQTLKAATTNAETLLTAYAALLARYSGRESIVLSVDGRNVRVSVEGSPDAKELARRCQYASPTDETGNHVVPAPGVEDVEIQLFFSSPVASSGAVQILRDDERGTIRIRVSESDRFTRDVVERMASHLENMIAAVHEAEKGVPFHQWPLLGTEERTLILAASNILVLEANADDHACLPNVVALFEEHARRSPDAIALVDNGKTLTYRALDEAANRLAARLGSRAYQNAVATFLPRGANVIVGFLGILKAGGMYVPIDTSYPESRVAAILEGARPAFVLTDSGDVHFSVGAAEVVRMDHQDDAEVAAAGSHQDHRPPIVSTDRAYAIFTSGSTGNPKGVVVDHASLASYARAAADAYGVTAGDRVLQSASLGFDLSLEEIVITLTAGATLVVRSAKPIESVQAFIDECCEQRLTVLSITSALWHELTMRLGDESVALPPLLKLVILGADVARPDVLAVWHRANQKSGRSVRLVNSYGLTETTIVASVWEADPNGRRDSFDASWRALPIGQPLRNASMYVLDASGQLQPIGIPGELCIGGPSVASHYLGDEELTRTRFVPDPIRTPGAHPHRMYRTFDRGVLRANGEFEFLGRSDYQVKVNGIRIELGEIETRLREYPHVLEAIVIAKKNTLGETELEAYVQASEHVESSALAAHLATVIPIAAVPASSRIHLVDQFPLTPAGKIDRRALATLATTAAQASRPREAAPTNPIEEKVLAAVSEALGAAPDTIGMLDSFRSLGGTSLAAVRAASLLGARLENDHRVRAPLFFEQKTLRDVANSVAKQANSLFGVIDLLSTAANSPLIHDAILAASIAPPKSKALPAPPKRLARVFLTGATGFYGSFVLDDLLRHTDAQIVCLVRAETQEAGERRILDALTRRRCRCLADDKQKIFANRRITIINGDIGQPNLGLTETVMSELAESITTIFHIGANVNMMLPYEELRASNVMAVESILRLATMGKPKIVHHVSTVEVLSDMDRNADGAFAFSERRTAKTAERLHDGYGQSKWVAEKLIEGARERGIRAYIHRPGRLLGHSETGVFNADDFLVRMLASCGRIKSLPQLDVDVDMTPVDYASRALVRLAESDPTHLERVEAFHLVHPETMTWSWLSDRVIDLGYPLETVSHDEWRARLSRSHHDADPRERDFDLYLAGMTKEELEASIRGGYASDLTQELLGDSLEAPPVHSNLLAMYLDTLAVAGRFPKAA